MDADQLAFRLRRTAASLEFLRATLHPLARPSEDVARFLNRVDPQVTSLHA